MASQCLPVLTDVAAARSPDAAPKVNLTATLLVQCPDAKGVVASLSQLLYGFGCEFTVQLLDSGLMEHVLDRLGCIMHRVIHAREMAPPFLVTATHTYQCVFDRGLCTCHSLWSPRVPLRHRQSAPRAAQLGAMRARVLTRGLTPACSSRAVVRCLMQVISFQATNSLTCEY